MTLGELLAQLSELAETVGEDLPVLVAHQPFHPLALEVHHVAFDEEDNSPNPSYSVAWVVCKEHPDWRSPYAPREVFE